MTGPHRVLLLEDEEALRKSMVRGLSKLPGLEVVDVGTVTEAKAALATSLAPALVISDLSLPDGLGVEIATELGRLGIPAPVVFVSAYVGKFKHHLPERGDFEVYEKPVPLEVLRGVVERKLDLADTSAPSRPRVRATFRNRRARRHVYALDAPNPPLDSSSGGLAVTSSLGDGAAWPPV